MKHRRESSAAHPFESSFVEPLGWRMHRTEEG
jgi:hypothetical protein